MEEIAWNFQDSIQAKNKRRLELAKLPYEEKVEILLVLQKMTAPLLQAHGKKVCPWNIIIE